MNYGPALVCNLQECLPPYFEFLRKLSEEGKNTAQIYYRCRGFVHHHNTDCWHSTNPVGLAHGQYSGADGSVTWSFWPMGGAWLTSELFKHYEYNEDRKFLLETAYPLLKTQRFFFWIGYRI
jgi:alpha-L-fucosidase 2